MYNARDAVSLLTQVYGWWLYIQEKNPFFVVLVIYNQMSFHEWPIVESLSMIDHILEVLPLFALLKKGAPKF